MNVSPTLTKDEFKDVHNAKCEMYQIQKQLTKLGITKLSAKMDKAMELMNRGLANAYKQDRAAFDSAATQFERTAKAEGFTSSQWSIYDVADRMGTVPFPEAKMLIYDRYTDTDLGVGLPPNATWVDLWRAADSLIKDSGDTHHVFIESITPKPGNKQVLLLGLGS